MEVVTKIAPIALALIMLALGLGLSGHDFLRVIKQPKDFILGLKLLREDGLQDIILALSTHFQVIANF